jgi:enamine deaminase RidA (YjgF/YER057c/UK114 family)
MNVDGRLHELGIELPATLNPAGNYAPAVIAGDLVFLSGAAPVRADGSLVSGKVGDGGLDLETAREAARLTGLQLIAILRAELGDLNRVHSVVKLFGMVNCMPGFTGTPAVIDGCSDLLVDVFGPSGRAARSAVGMAELPLDIPVEIEAVVRITP